jgi:hypothetical protein
MAFRLRRMVLINLGTNRHVPSGRITEIDPRGGAAVMGENGVGKTTTLRLVPLFFGHLPSQIVAAGQGREAMIRFVLPTGASAIVFEYQRGSERDEDIRLVVIRRKDDNSDAPEYRIYKTQFHKEFFIDEGRFLDDDETETRMRTHDVQGTRKLTPADYRCVILRTRSNTKDADRIRRYGIEHSFGPKALPNLDRLVAAMVKKHINFQDFVQVAVGMVQEDLGLSGERSKLTMKQGRAQIERWLSNRDACEAAVKIAPKVEELSLDLKNHRVAEAQFRELRGDVQAVKNAREREGGQIECEVNALVEARSEVETRESDIRTQLAEICVAATTTSDSATSSFKEAEGNAKYFDAERAAYWENQVEGLSALSFEKAGLDKQVIAATGANEAATIQYTTLWGQVEKDAADEALTLEGTKKPHQERYDAALISIGESERAAVQELNAELRVKRDQLDESLAPINEKVGELKAAVANPQPGENLVLAERGATDARQNHTEQLAEANTRFLEACTAETTAYAAFQRGESERLEAIRKVDEAERDVAVANENLSPANGTLWAALRSEDDEGWKKTMARVIHPDLLKRNDLDPQFLGDPKSLYGWSIRTDLIAQPDWTEDSMLRAAVADAEARLLALQGYATNADASAVATSRQLEIAQTAKNRAEAMHGVLLEKANAFRSNLEAARAMVVASATVAKTQAESLLTEARQVVDAIRRQMTDLDGEDARRRKDISEAACRQCKGADDLRIAAIRAINESIRAVQYAAVTRSSELKDQLKEHLSREGVDTQKLGILTAKASALGSDMDTREVKRPLVERWRTWVSENGATKVEQLRFKASNAATVANEAAVKLAEFEVAVATGKKAHDNLVKVKNDRLDVVNDELRILANLDDEFGDYLPQHHPVVDVSITAKEMRNGVARARQNIDSLERAISKQTNDIRTALTAKDSAVKEFVDASLARVADHGDISRANELCICYKQIGPQVITDVNTTLKAVLGNIGHFRKAIDAFESQVAAFNGKLQEGLSGVKRFKRVTELTLNITTNFDNLGFYKKLKQMDAVVRDHHAELGKDYSRDLPAATTAHALRDFLGVIHKDGSLEFNPADHIDLAGAVTENGRHKPFRNAIELENVSSDGLTSVILITLLSGLLNTIRAGEPVYVPWVTDEVGKFDSSNFVALMEMLSENHIDVVTASPELGITQLGMFSQRYVFADRGEIRRFKPKRQSAERSVLIETA